MNLSSRLSWLLMAAATVLLVSVLTFLYDKSQSVDEAHYLHDIATLRHLKQLDAQWELDVLRSRIGTSTHYDALAASLRELDRQLQSPDTDWTSDHHAEVPALAVAGAALVAAVQKKATLIEWFKSHNSVLRNSLAFLPTAADDMRYAASGTRGAAALAAAAAVDRLLLASVLYAQSVSDERAADMIGRLDELALSGKQLAPAVRERLEIFDAHARTILREQKTVNDLVGGIALVAPVERIDDVYELLTQEQTQNEAEMRRYREYLVIFAASLVALLLAAAIHLMRSHTLINRVNRELLGVNEHLEQRVRERTLELQHAQGELIGVNQHLEQRVRERTLELQQAQSEVLATARRAGMAEVATNVLHNVGNILNSVNVSASLISSTLRRSRTRGLGRAVAMMDARAGDLALFLTADEKGRLLPRYLRGLAGSLEQERQVMTEELGNLMRGIDHIKDVVATQQAYAGAVGVVESVHICELAEDALRMNGESLARHEVTIVREFGEVPVAPLDRGRVLQILVNLIKNARNAMEGEASGANHITLRIEAQDERLLVSVKDQGVGIPEENLARIFSHGFTTHATGHGFGLHSCALAAQQMGGKLRAHSEGPGRGATFTLELPIGKALAAI